VATIRLIVWVEFSTDCCLFPVSNSGLLFSHGRPSQHLLFSSSDENFDLRPWRPWRPSNL